MYRITYVLGGPLEEDLRLAQIGVLLDALVRTDMMELQARPRTPLLGRSGVSVVEDPTGTVPSNGSLWLDAGSALKPLEEGPYRGRVVVDPIGFMAARVAELRVRFKTQAALSMRTRRASNGALLFGVGVLLLDGTEEPPLGWSPVPTEERIVFGLDLFEGGKDRPLSHAVLRILLEAQVQIDVLYLQRHPETPPIYASGVQYEEEPFGLEDWCDIPTCLRHGVADCDDLAPWLAAQYRTRQGLLAISDFEGKRNPDGSFLYHIKTRLPNGLFEDPSRNMGMR